LGFACASLNHFYDVMRTVEMPNVVCWLVAVLAFSPRTYPCRPLSLLRSPFSNATEPFSQHRTGLRASTRNRDRDRGSGNGATTDMVVVAGTRPFPRAVLVACRLVRLLACSGKEAAHEKRRRGLVRCDTWHFDGKPRVPGFQGAGVSARGGRDRSVEPHRSRPRPDLQQLPDQQSVFLRTRPGGSGSGRGGVRAGRGAAGG
ncbi:unnamed protein product, partial [Ectocarpus sp. 8 AP-2014]